MENYKEKPADEETEKVATAGDIEIEEAISSLISATEDLDEEDVSAVAARIQEEQKVLKEFGY